MSLDAQLGFDSTQMSTGVEAYNYTRCSSWKISCSEQPYLH